MLKTIATCRYNRSSSRPDHQRGRLLSIDEEFYVRIGERYIVLGMMIWANVLRLLICNDNGDAGFYPAALFGCDATRVPQDWEFALGSGLVAVDRELWEKPFAAIWGYAELVRNPEHADAIQERDEAALLICFKELVRREQDIEQEGLL